MKSTNMLERLNQELKRRSHVVRIFSNAASGLRRIRALAVEMHENWPEAIRYRNMEHLREHKKEALGRWPPDGLWITLRVTHRPNRHIRHHDQFAELDAHNSVGLQPTELFRGASRDPPSRR